MINHELSLFSERINTLNNDAISFHPYHINSSLLLVDYISTQLYTRLIIYNWDTSHSIIYKNAVIGITKTTG